MIRSSFVFLIVALLVVGLPAASRADEAKVDVQDTIRKGLEWLAKSQHRTEGHFEANGGQYPTTMTALAGMCFLMEGSTMKEGKYSENVRKAVNWFLKRSQPNGLLGNPANPTESSRYMYGQGFGLLFLACVYGEEDDEKKRKEENDRLAEAIATAMKKQ